MISLVFAVLLLAVQQDPSASQATAILNHAYEQLRLKQYDEAVAGFRQALALDPLQVQVYKDLAYTLQKMGETESAVEAFEAYQTVRPGDYQTIMELAYLYVQVQKEDRALQFFRRAMASPDGAQAAQARQAYRDVETPILAEIARWSKALQQEPQNFDARESLAEAHVRHGDAEKAIEQYTWLRREAPSRYRHLIILSELHATLTTTGDAKSDAAHADAARAYALLAWRSSDPRVSGQGRALFNTLFNPGAEERYPYGPEFEKALELEPWQTGIRKELAYLYLTISQLGDQRDRAVVLLERVVHDAPQDEQSAAQLRELTAPAVPAAAAAQVAPAVEPPPAPAEDTAQHHKELGYASLQKSYLADAAREFEAALRRDPNDDQAILQLGYIYNMLHQDPTAVGWFKRALRSRDAKVAAQARQAIHNLEKPRFTTTVWALPLLSSRWDTAFGYGQIKTEWNTSNLPFRPYLSMRLEGDSTTRTGGTNPEVLSSDGVIASLGVIRPLNGHTWLWAEAGDSYSAVTHRTQPDYRGGVAYAKVWGAQLFGKESGRFLDTNFDAVYLSRVNHDTIAYTQTKTGYQLPPWRGLRQQVFLAANVVTDQQRNVYNNFVEAGPAYRFGVTQFKQVWAYVAFLHGVYTLPGRSNYNDLRLVVWWAKTF
jgi:tetratricopeptide (TPR) repeat protein